MQQPRVFIEVIDPVTERKVDVLVSFHSAWAGEGPNSEDPKVTAAHVRRIANDVVRCLTFGARFELSDIDEGDALG